MKVKVEKQPGSVSKLQIELPADEVAKEWDAIANSFARFAKIPGYRPGKAPRAVIDKRFRKEIQDELTKQSNKSNCAWLLLLTLMTSSLATTSRCASARLS